VVETDDMTEFSSTPFRRGKAVRFGLTIALLCLLLASMVRGPDTSSLVAVYIGIVVLVIAFLAIGFVRAFSTGIYVGDAGVVVKTTYSTKHWALESLERAASLDSVAVGSALYISSTLKRAEERTRMVPVLYRADGLDDRLYGLRMVSTSLHDGQWIDDAVAEINRRLELRRAP
jgi:hypothetical protein